MDDAARYFFVHPSPTVAPASPKSSLGAICPRLDAARAVTPRTSARLIWFVQRRLSHELMDDPAVPRAELERALGYIRGVNRALGGVRGLRTALERSCGAGIGASPITLLDVGTGSADLPIAAVRWACMRGIDLRITAIDNHATTLDLAREYLARPEHADAAGRIELLLADATDLAPALGSRRFDLAHAGMFLHHLPGGTITSVLRSLGQRCDAVIWNDLVRSRVGHVAITLATLMQPRIIRHDACASVAAGFTPREVRDHASDAGLELRWHQRSFLTHRFVAILAPRSPARPAPRTTGLA